MGAFVTKDPDKAVFKVATSDPSQGFGAGTLFGAKPEEELTPEQLERRQRSGAIPQQMKKGGKVSSASKRADGCAVRGKTKGRMV